MKTTILVAPRFNSHPMKYVALILFFLSSVCNGAEKLSSEDKLFLKRFDSLRPGMSEQQVRDIFPEMGALSKEKKEISSPREVMASSFTPQEQTTEVFNVKVEFYDGKLSGVHAFSGFSSADEPKRQIDERVFEKKARRLKRLVNSHFENLYGKTQELWVPNLDCPGGNPIGLRKMWKMKDRIVSVEFAKNSSNASVDITLWEKMEWLAEQKSLYESSWPLGPLKSVK